uniref:SRA stem-loop interacting RNA binding protein n=1 Tax=Molossus molossus TaxID=27622 RepID=A0A7J8K269_MOLMO|nr:SRA stem-loop interacting RNA binding protein [Molossus molossus]
MLAGPLLLSEKFPGPPARDKETGFHRGMGWIQFSSSEELQNALQQDSHVIDGVKLHVQAQRPKMLQGDQTSDEEKDF